MPGVHIRLFAPMLVRRASTEDCKRYSCWATGDVPINKQKLLQAQDTAAGWSLQRLFGGFRAKRGASQESNWDILRPCGLGGGWLLRSTNRTCCVDSEA